MTSNCYDVILFERTREDNVNFKEINDFQTRFSKMNEIKGREMEITHLAILSPRLRVEW